MTDEQIQTAHNCIGTALARAQRPLKEAGGLLRLPKADVISHTIVLLKGLCSEWRLRIEDLNTKMLAWLEGRRAENAAAENLSELRQRKAEMEQASRDNRARFRELLGQNRGNVTPEMKTLPAEYLKQQETAFDVP